jgi:hypothetical protein
MINPRRTVRARVVVVAILVPVLTRCHLMAVGNPHSPRVLAFPLLWPAIRLYPNDPLVFKPALLLNSALWGCAVSLLLVWFSMWLLRRTRAAPRSP